MAQYAFITGLSGTALTEAEARFLRASRPAGIILFARNVETPEQVRRLLAEAKAAIGAEVLALVDQEGGRVQRLRPPHWRALPSGANYGRHAATDLAAATRDARDVARLIAHDLSALGFNCNCVPVLDLPIPGAHDVIGTRALGCDVSTVVALGRAIADGHIAGGVLPVMKHMPGHGRSMVDTHHQLPFVDAPEAELSATDFAPFKALAHLPAGMTAHLVFTAIDPANPASTSRIVTTRIIRGHIGFDGLLMSDDLSMQALSGTLYERAQAVLRAGTDLALHCNGKLDEMEQVAAAAPTLQAKSAARYEAALECTRTAQPFSIADAEGCLARLMGVTAVS